MLYLYNDQVGDGHGALVDVIRQSGGDVATDWVDRKTTVGVAAHDGVGWVIVQVLVDRSPLGVQRDLKRQTLRLETSDVIDM